MCDSLDRDGNRDWTVVVVVIVVVVTIIAVVTVTTTGWLSGCGDGLNL